jgi:hypothetical protein
MPSARRLTLRSKLLTMGVCLSVLMSACDDAADPPSGPPRALGLSPPAVEFPASAEPSRAPSFTGELASIAAETSIYEEPRWGAKRLGYLRAGGVVRRGAEAVASGPRCPDGWYHVEPRGFVCVGSMATLDVRHAVALAMAHPPRMDGLPWLYVLSRSPTPLLYARLPSLSQEREHEPELHARLAEIGAPPGLPPADPVPAFLAPGSPSLSLGNDWHDPGRVVLGRARPRSGFALLATFDHEGRRFGLTAELEILPLDRTRLVTPSRFAGLALAGGPGLPVAFVKRPGVTRVVDGPSGLVPGAALEFRNAIPVTENVRDAGGLTFLVARDGSLIRSDMVVLARAMRHPPTWALEGAKWIDVSIPRQVLVAYEGTTPVYTTLVSTGLGGTGDPDETHATIQGAFTIYEKHVTVTMNGRDRSDPFDLRDVPFVQYFHEGFALHAAYWHDDFGHVHSHGCINLAPADAAWLFAWTDPHLPPGWHGAMAREGTIVYVHD